MRRFRDNTDRTRHLLVFSALLASAVFFGCGRDSSSSLYPSREYELLTILGDVQDHPDADPGRWRPVRDGAPMGNISEEERSRLSELMTLPYLQGSKVSSGSSDVTRFDSERAWHGINLYTSGHSPEAFLMDMEGNVLHTWRFRVEQAWPEVPQTIHSTFFRRVQAYPNGDLLAIFEGIGLVKIDHDSKLIWHYRGGCHHQAFVAPDGKIYVLTRKAQVVERINPDRPIVPDAITILDADGKLLREVPLLECFEKTDFRVLLRMIRSTGDIFHTNSIFVFDGSLAERDPLLARGNVLISLLTIDTIAIVDMDKEEIAWAQTGRGNEFWKKQHDPTLLPNGNILLFDNRGYEKKSRVMEYNAVEARVAWQFTGNDSDQLFSATCGTSRLLPNGNILITESDNGRSLEITRDHQVVWEFYNPHRTGERNELIATLFELERLDLDYFPWLSSGRPDPQ